MSRRASARTRVFLAGASILLLSRFAMASAARSSTARKRTSGGQTVVVTGSVHDASGGGWPLYARIDVGPGGGPPDATAFTDPVTGAYAITVDGGRDPSLHGPGRVGRLRAGGGRRSHPERHGPRLRPPRGPPGVHRAGIRRTRAGGLLGGRAADRVVAQVRRHAVADPVGARPVRRIRREPDRRHRPLRGRELLRPRDLRHAAADPDARPRRSPPPPRSTGTTTTSTSSSIADVDVSTDGGTHWTNVWERSGVDERGPGVQTVDLTATRRGSAHRPGPLPISDVLLVLVAGRQRVLRRAGRDVPGAVREGWSSEPSATATRATRSNGATVTELPHRAVARTFATPDDPNPNANAGLLHPLRRQPAIRRSRPSDDRYSPQRRGRDRRRRTARCGRTSRSRPGSLAAAPRPVDARALPGETVQQVADALQRGIARRGLHDRRDRPAAAAAPPRGPVRVAGGPPPQPLPAACLLRAPRDALRRAERAGPSAARRRAPEHPRRSRPAASSARSRPASPGPGASPSTPTRATSGCRISSPSNGDDRDYRLLPDGTVTGDTIDEHDAIGVFAADGAYNPRTKTFWRVDAVELGSSCIFELDPATLTVTGNRICPETGTSRARARLRRDDGHLLHRLLERRRGQTLLLRRHASRLGDRQPAHRGSRLQPLDAPSFRPGQPRRTRDTT